jgi:hypothetical protein
MRDVGAVGLIGGAYILLGIWIALRKRFVLEFGRVGFLKPKPLVIFRLTGIRAFLFGIICLFVGLIMVVSSGYLWATNNVEIVESGLLLVLAIVGTGIALLTFVFELFLELLAQLRNEAENNKD